MQVSEQVCVCIRVHVYPVCIHVYPAHIYKYATGNMYVWLRMCLQYMLSKNVCLVLYHTQFTRSLDKYEQVGCTLNGTQKKL